MANRQTKRERKEEARQRRLEELKRRQRKARMRKVWTVVVIAAAVGGLIAIIAVAKSGSNKKTADLNAVAATGGCEPLESFSEEGHDHVEPGTIVQYKTTPPTSGNHYGKGAPAATGIHTEPVQNEVEVHNLEHGHIVVQYQPTLDPDRLKELEDFTRSDAQWILLAPNPNIPDPIDFTAWTHLMRCKSPNTKTVDVAKAFKAELKDKGREHIPGSPIGV